MKYISAITVNGAPFVACYIKHDKVVLTIKDDSTNEEYYIDPSEEDIDESIYGVGVCLEKFGPYNNSFIVITKLDIIFLSLIDNIFEEAREYDRIFEKLMFLHKANNTNTLFADNGVDSQNFIITLHTLFQKACDFKPELLEKDLFTFLVHDGKNNKHILNFKITEKIRNFYRKSKVLL